MSRVPTSELFVNRLNVEAQRSISGNMCPCEVDAVTPWWIGNVVSIDFAKSEAGESGLRRLATPEKILFLHKFHWQQLVHFLHPLK